MKLDDKSAVYEYDAKLYNRVSTVTRKTVDFELGANQQNIKFEVCFWI